MATDDVAALKLRIKELEDETVQLRAQLSMNKARDEITTGPSIDNDNKNEETLSTIPGTKDDKIKQLENQLDNLKKSNKELAMKAAHYTAMNTIQRNLPTIWHSPHININHISTFINKIPIAHKNKLWERHCDENNNKIMKLNNLNALMFSIVALCIKIHDRSVKTPSHDKLMPRLKIYCKNVKWNIKQKIQKENELKVEQLQQEQNKQGNQSENENNNNNNNNNKKKKNKNKNKKKGKNGSVKTDGKGEKGMKDEIKENNDTENEDTTTDSKNENDDNNNNINNNNKKYLMYDDFCNNFHRWLIEGPPPPTFEEQEKMLFYARYDGDSDYSQDSDNEDDGFLQLVDKVENCLNLVDKARY